MRHRTLRARITAFVLMTTLLAMSSTVLALVTNAEVAEGAMCPMMTRPQPGETCVGAPCPCEHPKAMWLALEPSLAPPPDVAVTAPLPVPRRMMRVDHTLPQDGFPRSVDRPPSRRA